MRLSLAQVIEYGRERSGRPIVTERDDRIPDGWYEIRVHCDSTDRIVGSKRSLATLAVQSSRYGGKYTGRIEAGAVQEALRGALEPVLVGRGLLYHSS